MLAMDNGHTSSPAGNDSLTDMTVRLREQISEAQGLLETGDVKGAEALGKATLQLIRALEAQVKLEDSQKQEQKKGVFYDETDIARARDELTRRLDRLAKTLRADEMDRGAE